MKRFDLYEAVTNRIIEKLEQGTVPWRQAWQNGTAVNWASQRPYRGINVLLLDAGEYATFKQITEAGGKIRKGEKGHMVIFWKWIEVEDGVDKEGNPKTKTIPFIKYYKVWEINTQCEGLESKRGPIKYDHDPIVAAEKVVAGYRNAPTIRYQEGRAFYSHGSDLVSVPPMSNFDDVNEFYSTLFHELVHSTGARHRLAREGVIAARFGNQNYSKEELIAEIGASFLNAECGILPETIDNSAAYIKEWLGLLKNDKKLIVQASQAAQKAVDYILGRKQEF